MTTTITSPNFFAVATDTTPAWTVPSGMTAKVIDAAGAQTINIALGGMLDLQSALGANAFVFEGITDYIAKRNGSTLELSTALGGIFAKIPASATAQTVKLGAAAAVPLVITAGVVTLNGTAVESVPVTSTFTVTNTAGVITFGGTATGVVTVTNTAGTLSFARDGVTATTTTPILLSAVTSIPAVTVAGTTTVADANLFDAKSTEIITATISDTAANLATLTGTGNAYAVTISGTTAATLAQLKTINTATTGAITLNAETIAVTLSGSAADLAAALTGITTHNAAITVTDTATAPIAATILSTIGGATAGTVTVTNAIAISGTVAEATAALVTVATKVTAASATVTLSDVGTAVAADLAAINTATTGLVTAAAVTTLTGTAANIASVTNAMGISGDKIALAGLTTLQPSGVVADGDFDTTTFTQTDVTLTLADVASNTVDMVDINVLPGAVFKVNGAALTGTNALTFTGGAEVSGTFSVTGGAAVDNITGGGGNDTLDGGANNDVLTGGAGNDTYNITAGTDSVIGLATGDVLVVSSGATANVALATGTPAFVATSSTTNAGTLTIGTGVATTTATVDLSAMTTNTGTVNIDLTAGSGVTGAALASGATTIKGTGAGVTNIKGGAAVDTITAAVGGGSITGGASADLITLGSAVDTVKMTTGITNGTDQITSFTRGVGGDNFTFSIGATDGTSLAAINGAGANIAAAATVLINSVTGTETLVAGDNIVELTGATFTSATMLTFLSTNVTLQAAPTTADDLLVLWTDGTNAYLSAVNIAGTAAALSGNILTNGGDIVQFTGITSLSAADFVPANFTFIA